MHHALYVEEILLNIFGFCYVIVSPWSSSATGRQLSYANVHLATLARTCRAFNEPALDMIWTELEDLTPLVRCLPGSLWDKSKWAYCLLKQPLEQPEWDVILACARRVQVLRLRGSAGLTVDCIKELVKSPTLIFPNIRVVELYKPHKASVAPFIPHFAGPKLAELSLSFAEGLGAAIDTFGLQCPAVTHIRVSPWSNTATISGLLLRWENLSSVQCGSIGLNVDVLSHLSRSRNLSFLNFEIHDAVLDWFRSHSSTPTVNFAALRSLHLVSGSWTTVRVAFRYFCVPQIQNLLLSLYARPTASEIISLFATLQDVCKHDALNHLELHTPKCDFRLKASPTPNSLLNHITVDHLRPLTIFMNINTVVLNTSCGVDLNECEFLSLASSWPHLEKFMVGEDYDWTESSAITPGGFLQLLERCRFLRVLYFRFDTCGYTEIPQGHPWRGLTMAEDAAIHLLNSPIEQESIQALGSFFQVAPFPNFSLTSHWSNPLFKGSKRPSRELCDLYSDMWEDVRTLASKLWREQGDLRRSLESRSLQRRS